MRTVLVLVSCLIAVPVLQSGERTPPGKGRPDDPGAPGHSRPAPRPVPVNRIADLLDEEVYLETGTDQEVWESGVFDTSRFTVIGLRVSGEADSGCLVCAVGWQFGSDDPFEVSLPSDLIIAPIVVPDPDPGDRSRPDGFPDLYPQRPGWPVGVPLTDFDGVRGIRAKVICQAPLGCPYVLGGDPTLPEPSAGALGDVKVLLRCY
jgi:hypothetical protein